MKLVTITTGLEELQELVPLLRDLYFSGSVELLSLVNTEAEAKLNAYLNIHRRLREYAWPPPASDEPLKDQKLLAAARAAMMEERPDLILWGRKSFLQDGLKALLRDQGIAEYVLGQSSETSVKAILSTLRTLDVQRKPVAPGLVTVDEFLTPHWRKLAQTLREGPCLLHTTPHLEKQCREKLPAIDWHTQPTLERYPQGLSLLESSFAETPGLRLQELREKCDETYSLEPVNSPISGARFNFCYHDYDNEFALAKPDFDLKQALGEGHHTVIWDARSGQAGSHHLPHPDGKYPAFFTTWSERQPLWYEKYQLPEGEKLKIVFADSQNVAGSVLHHADAVNRFTSSVAWAVTDQPHPFIGPREGDEHTHYLRGAKEPSPELRRLLESADCFVFFEDDDENSDHWPFSLAPFVEGKAVLHLYIGFRVHAKTPLMCRAGRTILTPLPHLLKMYPESHFYAGFPPRIPDSEVESPPRSTEDGICRFLHTPSLPHWTTSRYPYHKDTEAFLRVARSLKAKYKDRVEFVQVAGWDHKGVLEARKICDVTFNQLRGFHGLSGDEAMALGRVCVQYFDQLNTNRHREYWGLGADFPWLNSNAESLEETFCRLVEDPDWRSRVGERSRHFMRKYFSPQKGILPLLYHCYRAVRGGTTD
ncbi:MAG TPA: glycosyltransferase family 1 protein [Phycisphaerales bacterium]|nr:glycosyltransferase family 1 protein [Phycisphaerales bacterium]